MLIYLIFPKIEMHVKQNENKYRLKKSTDRADV